MTLETHGQVQQYNESDITNTSEKISPPKVERSVEVSTATEEVAETAEILSPKNARMFEKMSTGGRAVATGIYEGLKNVPGAKWLVGKIGIAYNEKRMFGQEKKAAELKSELDTLSIKSTKLSESKKSIESIADRLEKGNIPGSESIRLKLREIDEQITKLQNKQDTVHSKIENRNNKIAIFTNKRDSLADSLIGHYNEKLVPLEANIESLNTSRDHLDLLISVAAASHLEQNTQLSNIESEKIALENELREIGMSDAQIKNFAGVAILNTQIIEGRQSIAEDQANFAKRRNAIDKRIADADNKANPHRDNRESFIRIKQGRPIEIELQERFRQNDTTFRQEIVSSSRSYDDKYENEAQDEEYERSIDYAEKPVFSMLSAVNSWNMYLNTLNTLENKDLAQALRVDENTFLKATMSAPDSVLPVESFKQVFGKYLQYKKVVAPETGKIIDDFLTSLNKK